MTSTQQNDIISIQSVTGDTNLSPFSVTPTATFTWGDCNAEKFTHNVTKAYEEVIHWRRNIFYIPSGHAGSDFVKETARLFDSCFPEGH